MLKGGYNTTMKKQSKYEAFKIASDLMQKIRDFAKQDQRSIRVTIENVLRERFFPKAGK